MEQVEQVEAVEVGEAHGVAELITAEEVREQETQQQQQEDAEKASQPTAAEMEKARLLAQRMNRAFLWGVDKFVCPSVPVDEIADRTQGDEVLVPVALALGGELPPWLDRLLNQYQPYISAGLYMGMTIYTARAVEMAVRKEAEEQAAAKQREEVDTNGD